MNTDVDDEHEDEFGIKQPSLVESLKRILDEYPDDGQILKELIQNAEDAPASTIKFLYDEQSYTVENLYCPSMAEFNQNPALIVYNDGIFTQRDWNTIGNLGVSKKKEDPIKVGKFGLGFKSVFHITDCPMIVSGNTFGIIDPNQKYFKDKSGRLLSGFKWTLSSEYVPTGHLAPFLDKFGFKGDELQGTIFRFPLRQNPSPLSDTIYTKDKVDSLLQGLTYNAYMKVLFLTNINKIEIYRHNKSLQYRSAVITCTEKAIEKVHFDGVTTCPTRAKFKQSLRNMTETGGAWACVTGLNIKTEKISNNGHSEKEDHSFVISHFCEKSEKASRLENLAEKQGNMPWVSCALDRNKKNYYPDGHVFVFLPLPMEGKSLSGLPVHVNGYFAISQNRRHLKWPSDEQLVKASSSKDTNDLEWNNQILSELLPKAYMNALKVHGSKGNICKYLPNPDDVDEKWKTLILEPFFSKLLHLELFHTTVKKEKMTVSLTDACLLVPGKNDNDEMMTIVSKVLTAADYGVVRVPDYVENAVRIYTGHQLLVATPDVIRQAMKTNPSSYKKRSDVDKMRLLEYILRDNCYTELKEIVLLPLENGQYAEFQEPKRKNIIYVADEDNPQSLLPGITDRFLRKCIPESMKMQLVGAGQQGHIQLRQLTPDGVIDLLPRVLYNNKDRCSNDELLTVYKHKTLITGEWYRKIWRYIVEKMHGEISKISHLHLILVEMNSNTHEWKFGCLKTRNAYVVRHHSTQQLSKKICIVLKAIGIIVIPNLMEEILRCPGILEGGDHMYKPTADGIVQAIYKLYENDTFFMTNAANLPKNIDNDSLDALRGYIAASNLSAISNDQLKCLQFIAIFNQVGNSSERIAFHKAEKVMISCNLPVDLPKIEIAIDARDNDSATIVRLFSCDILHECEVLERFIFPDIRNGKMRQNEVDELMEYVLQHKQKYASENTQFIETLKQLPFIRTSGGNFCASELFDFSDNCLFSVFEENQFPRRETWQKLCCELKDIGLKGRQDVKISDLAQAVERLAIRKKDKTSLNSLNHITELLRLQKKENMTSDEYATFRETAWLLPVDRPHSYPRSLKWKNDSTKKFIKPCEAMNSGCADTAGGVVNIVDIDKYVASLFDISDSPTLPQLVSQLKEVLQSYTTREKTQHLLLVGRIYEELERNSKECVTLKMELQNQNIEDWIWHGNGFVAVHRICIIKPDIDVKPYCYHLPPEMLQYKKWWTALGVAETINYFSVLHQIKLHHDSDQEKCDDTRDHDLNMVVNILNHFYTAGFDVRSGEIYLPVLINDKIRLVPPGECTICPSVPEQMNIKNEVDEEIKAVHPHLSEQVAERFGAYPLMKRLLNDADDFGSKGWGQQESLVRRLKNILRDYTDGFALPKELIQNADDAGATEVKLLWDERQNIHYNTKLLHEEMKHCQGPALWAYNNSVFTKNDLLNIKKLGGATKESDTVKIGRFGLGFNSVYNITDVPSFISEENLVIFDPHTTYLNIQGQPGILINLKKKPMIFHRAPDQIAPFQGVFGCELSLGNCKFNGTLFRFPLRTPYQAGKSEICEVVYKQQRMEELLNMMKDGLNIMLLFTQHVHKVSVYHLKEDASGPSQMVELFSAEKSFVLEKKHLPIHQITLNIETDERLMKASTVNVAAKLCFDTEQSFEAGYVSEMSLKTKEKCSKEKWLITSYNSNKRTTLTIAKELKTLPLGAVAIQLGDYFSPAPVEGRVFCHLPLPIESGLPFHINGCFAVASNRRFLEIRTQDDVANKRADWNNELCSDSVLQAFLYALEVLKESNTYENVLTLFPVREKTTDTSRRLCDAFYTHITRSSCAVFYDGEKWRSFNEVQFLSEELLDCELVDDVTDVINSYSKWGQVIVKCPSNIITELSLTNEKVKKKVLEKTWTVFSFIKDSFLPNVTKIKPTMRDRLLRFGLSLSESNPWVKELLSSTECFPVKGSSMLRKPADLVDPLGKCKMLYDEDDERFPPSEFLDDASRQALLNLKMIGDKLPINNVLERAKSIKRIEFEFGKKRMHFLLDHLQSIIPSGQLPKAWRNVQKQLVHIEFLLVKYRTADWNELPWKGEVFGEVFEKPVSLYSHKYEDLIGSIHPVTCSAIPSKVMHFLEIDEKTPSMVDVFKQLEHYQRLQGISSKNEIRIKRIYQFLNNNATGNEDVLEEHLMHILVHNIFMPVVHVALNFRMSTCLPYLAQVPRYFSNYKRLMEICDIRQQFTCKDYIEALARMKSAGETDIQNILGLIDSFSRHMESENKCSADFDEIIYLIDAANEWKSAKELSYNNMPWFDATAGQNFAHRNIVFRYAQRLGVRTSIESFLESNSRDLFGGISFGQKERLTTRLRRLVEGYPQETIIKELLQNADDAGATEIHLILDTNTYEANTIIGEQYRPIQGPALLVYNDKPFRKSDLIGIQNLGEGSKGIDPTATGQYGVGFNCVYSLTDTPQILSEGDEIGKVLCIFDPNCRYIPLANESSPGKLYDVNDKFASQFPDMFKPFNLTDLPIKGKTIFRFPLRTANMASTSNICSEAMTPANINKLLSLFEAESKNAMLFLKSIEKISISLKTEIMKEASVHYSISSKISDEHRKGKMAFNMEIRQMSECIYKFGDTTAINRQVDELHEVHLVDNKGKTETWMVSQVIGIGTNSFEESLKCAVNEKKLRLLPCGGVACRIDFDQSAINTTKSGKLYCFLPLPVDITPPVHINGHFALDETRRALWRDTNGGYRTDWNNLIMRHVAPVAHCLLVEYVQEMIVNDQTTRRNYEHQLSTMIPEKDDSNAYLHTFIESLYGHFKRRDSKLFITHYNRWFSISDLVDGKAFLDDLDNHTIRSSLIAVEFPLIKLVSPWLQDLLISLDYQVKTVKPQFVLDFFRQYRPSATKLSETPLGDVNNVISILQYCSNIRESFVSQLDGVCLCVTTADNLIPFKSVKPIFYSDYCDLLPPNECLFLSKRVCDLLSKYIDLSSCSVMKPFTLDDLAKLIHLSLPESQYKNAVVPSEDLMEGKWLKRLWEFVTEQISAIANLNMPYEQCRAEIGKVNCLNDWSLLPVITKSGKQLYPIKWAESVLNLHESDENPIKWHIEQFGLPTLDESFFGSVKAFKQISVFTVLNKMTCLLMYPGHVLSALTRHLDADNENEHSVHTATASWNCQQFQTILEYFASFFATGNACENDAACIRRLPIHETVRENRVPLQATGVYVIPRGMPYDGMLDSNIFANFLKENGVKAVNKMYRIIGCVVQTEVELYVSFILPVGFERYNTMERKAHLRYLRDHYICYKPAASQKYISRGSREIPLADFNREVNILINTLSKISFLPNQNGEEKTAKELYNPKIPVFRVMHSDNEFLHESFVESEWITFLEKIGLRSSVSQEELVTYAKTVECDGRAVILKAGPEHLYEESIDGTYSVTNKAKAIVENIYDRNDLSTQTIEELKKIKFIPVNKGIMSKLCPQTDPKYLISFSGSVTSINMPLCWSCMDVLPVWATPKNTDIKSRFGVYENPPQSMISLHCKNVCQHLADSNKHEVCSRYSKEIEEMMNNIYCRLEGYENLEELNDVPCVFVSSGRNYFVYPRQVVINFREEDQIEPYLLRRPVYCSHLESMLEKIGVSKNVTMQHYANVLADIEKLYGDKRLNDNDFSKAVQASLKFYNLIGLEHNNNSRNEDTKKDYTLLIRGKTLRKSSQIYYIDGYRYKGRMKEIKENLLMERHRHDDEPVIIIKPWEKEILTRISFLQPISTLLIEELSESCKVNVYSASTQPFITIQQNLLDPNVHEAIHRVIRHFAKPQEAKNITLDEVSTYYQQIQIFECQQLETVLKCRGKVITESKENVDNFNTVDSLAVGCIRFYFTHIEEAPRYAATRRMKNIANIFSNQYATKYIGSFDDLDGFRECMYAIIFAGPETGLLEILKRWHIDMSDEFNDDDVLPSAGSYIPVADHHLLSNRFASFHTGDYVGYKIHDDILDNENGDSGAVYIYGIIIERVQNEENTSSGEVPRRLDHCYKVNIGDRKVEIYGYELYKFLRYDDEEKDLIVPDELDMSPIDTEKELEQLLKTAWTLDPSERNKIILRLLANYSDNDAILDCIKKQNKQEEENYKRRVSSQEPGSNFVDDRNFDIDLATSYLKARQDQHRNDRERCLRALQNNSKRCGRSRRSTFVPGMMSKGRNPQPIEARKWLQQAEITLKTVPNDVSGGFHFMTIFKCHLTCEQALIAMVHARDSLQYGHHESKPNLVRLTGKIDDCSGEVQRLAAKLQCDICHDRTRLFYPSRFGGRPTEIPHTAFSETESTEAQLIAAELVKLAKEYVVNAI